MGWWLQQGDCLDVLPTLQADSIHSICTDPPASIFFMHREWDSDKGGREQWVGWMTKVMRECYRVLKPGGHMLVWAIPRRAHWTATAIEDAGFEIRDSLVHIFGTGFPKSKNLGDGMGSALKPGHEIWVLARKPVEGSITANYARYGTGALNIDASRVDRAADDVPGWHKTGSYGRTDGFLGTETFKIRDMPPEEVQARCGGKGRWPSNLLLSHSPDCRRVGTQKVRGSKLDHDCSDSYFGLPTARKTGYTDADGMEEVEVWQCALDCPVAEIDRQSGVTKSTGVTRKGSGILKAGSVSQCGGLMSDPSFTDYGDSGGASRFFPSFRYQAKPSRSEREAGLEALPERILNRVNPGGIEDDPRWAPVQVKNAHPTVKSKALMKWLITLITPPKGCVLDPFAGSGSTGVAAIENGFSFYGIEKEPDFYQIAEARIEFAVAEKEGQMSLFDEDEL